MLSEIASLFDPMKWLAPIIIVAKMLIQEHWLRGCNWDTPVDEDIENAWADFRGSLNSISDLRIPRWFSTNKSSTWELHGFSDASKRAYAAIIYLVNKDTQPHEVILITAKSKVAPVKTMIITRLELCGAQLLARLVHSSLGNLQHRSAAVYCLSDSTTTLAWLRGHPSR